jgi:hypothetical protein
MSKDEPERGRASLQFRDKSGEIVAYRFGTGAVVTGPTLSLGAKAKGH